MAFGVVEWFVLVFAIGVIVKLFIVSFNAKGWLKFAKSLYKNPAILIIVEVILAAVLFYYLLGRISIIYIIAGVLLGALLTGLTFAIYAKESIGWAGKFLKSKSLLKRAWLPVLIWLALAIWVLIELF